MLTLPPEMRSAFKEPLGPVYTDTDALLADAGDPVVAVGDVVTYHLRAAGRDPDVAVVDGKTKREAVPPEVEAALTGERRRLTVSNPPATLSEALLSALVDALAAAGPVDVWVDGEEDLAALPAVLCVPAGGSVVYGQPDEGMVLVRATPAAKARARDLLGRMDGDVDAALGIVDD